MNKFKRLAGQVGQGTVEYVALILLVALVMAGVVAAMEGYKTDGGKDLGDPIIGKTKDAVAKVKFCRWAAMGGAPPPGVRPLGPHSRGSDVDRTHPIAVFDSGVG